MNRFYQSSIYLCIYLFRIGTTPPSYLFGTIHVPYTRVWDFVAKNTIKAFMNAEKVYFELDLTNPYTISALTSCQLLPRRLNLSQVFLCFLCLQVFLCFYVSMFLMFLYYCNVLSKNCNMLPSCGCTIRIFNQECTLYI